MTKLLKSKSGSFLTCTYKDNKPTPTKVYACWLAMKNRCTNEKFLEKNPQYRGVTLAKEWEDFQVFASWYERNYVEGWQLDKDILCVEGKRYSPETCVFVPQEVNILITSKKINKTLPLGVRLSSNKKRFVSILKGVHLGVFDTAEEASEAYIRAKLIHAECVMKPFLESGKLSKLIYISVLDRIKSTK